MLALNLVRHLKKYKKQRGASKKKKKEREMKNVPDRALSTLVRIDGTVIHYNRKDITAD